MITQALLEAHCRRRPDDMTNEQAFDACFALRPYARWWLKPEVLAKAQEFDDCDPLHLAEPVVCPVEPGACNLLLVRGPEYAALAPAFVLPVHWRPGRPHANLPRGLTDLADFVLRQFSTTGWGLEPALDRGLSEDLHWTFRSAWAALAGGLVLAKYGLHSRPGVFASACWNESYGAQSVEGLAEKLDLAARICGQAIAIAPGQIEEAQTHEGGLSSIALHSGPIPGAAIRPLLSRIVLNLGINPRTVLQTYLAQLGAPPLVDPDAPDRDEQFRRGVSHYQLLPFRSEQHRSYYFDHLMPVVRDRLRVAACTALDSYSPSALAAVVSDGWDLIPVLASALGVKRVLLLHTAGYVKHLSSVCARLADVGIPGGAVTTRMFGFPTMRGNLSQHLSEFACEPDELITDVTLGTVQMSLTLEQIVRNQFPTSRLVYAAHRTPDGRLEPGREYPLIWRANAEMPGLPSTHEEF